MKYWLIRLRRTVAVRIYLWRLQRAMKRGEHLNVTVTKR